MIQPHRDRKYNNRVILPMFYEKKFVYFTARDITGKSKLKYLHPASDEVNGNGTGSILYNLDLFKEGDIAVICEGPFNCFHKTDDDFILLAVNGKAIGINQFRKIERKKPSKYVIAYDNDKYFHDSVVKTYKFLSENSKIPVEVIDWKKYYEIDKKICDFGDIYEKIDKLTIHSCTVKKYIMKKFFEF